MKQVKKSIFWLLILIIGGLGGIIADRYIFPYLSSSDFFSKYKLFRKSAEEVTVINKTEQVFVKEENTVNKVTSKTSSSLVRILAYQENKKINTAQEGIGLIVTSDGLILTANSNFYTKNVKFKITLFDGSSYDGELFGFDSFSNLVFLKINAANLNTASFANSDEIKAGEKIIAFGKNSGEQIFSISSGLIKSFQNSYNLSGKTIASSEKLEGVYLTDLNLDEDFKGGVITDFASQVIGIVSSLEKDGGEEYFAIPANKIKLIIDRAIKKELELSPTLGIYYISLNKANSLIYETQRDSGAMIFTPSLKSSLAIIAKSPAEKAGFKINDVITKINEQEIDLNNPLADVLYQYKKGDTIKITFLRNNEEIVKEVTL
jgi:serine protease Do